MHSRHLYRRLLVCVTASALLLHSPAFLAPLPAHAEVSVSVLIGEVAWAGSTTSLADEWLELVNITNTTATVGGWSIHGAGESNRTIFLPADAVIAPFGTYLVANYPDTDTRSALLGPINIATTTVSLSNSVLLIELRDTQNVLIDRAGTGSIPPAGSSSPKASMIRQLATSTEAIIVEWISATSSYGFKTNVTDLGTPGICDICTPIVDIDLPIEEVPTEIVSEIVTEPSLPPALAETAVIETVATTTVAMTTTTTNVVSEPVESSPPKQIIVVPPLLFTLNEVVSNPAEGPEWIELVLQDHSATSTDRVLELWDAVGRMTTIQLQTSVTTPGFLVVSLASARLNNSGDTLSLREADGAVLDLITIPALEDGIAWAKRANAATWTETSQLTPGAENTFPEPVVTITQPTPAPIIATTSTTITPVPVITATSTTTAPPLHYLLNEALPHPVTGEKEWVELIVMETTATTTDRLLELWDATGKIAKIPQGTSINTDRLILIMLPSARLNNGGDELSLRDTDMLDSVELPSLEEGIALARDSHGAWQSTPLPTPGAPNALFTPSVTESGEPSALPETITSMPHALIAEAEPTSAPAAPSPTNARVRLIGTVGSVPRLLGATHAFILLGEDGRGVISYLPKHLNTPTFGTTVRVMGTLTSTERGLELRMKPTDLWMTIATSTPPEPRMVDLLSPGAEDAWSLVSVMGTVTEVKAKAFMINAEGINVSVNVAPAVGYRSKRLVKGDAVRVTGLLDIRRDTPTLMPRVPEDIVLMEHAPSSVAAGGQNKKSGIPDWLPFGAAAGAVATTGVAKRVHGILKRRQLELMITKAKT